MSFGRLGSRVSPVSLALLICGCAVGPNTAASHRPLQSGGYAVAPQASSSVRAAGSQRRLCLFLCGCPTCRRVASELERLRGESASVSVEGITEMPPGDIRVFASEAGLHFPIIPDAGGHAREALRVSRCPTLVLIAPSGREAGRWELEDVPSGPTAARATIRRILSLEGTR